MIVGDPIVLPLVRHRTVVHLGGGIVFTVWEPIGRFRRVIVRAQRRHKLIEVSGVKRYALNPLQITIAEGLR